MFDLTGLLSFKNTNHQVCSCFRRIAMWFNTASNKQQATRHIFMAAQPTRPKVPPEIRVFNMALLEENNG